jgi:hypothetical protein
MSKSELNKLRKVWYKKLKEQTDFKDIETFKGDLINGTTAWNCRSLGSVHGQAKSEYFYKAFQFLHYHEFEKEIHKVIWEYHCEGISVEEISSTLRKAGVTNYFKYVKKCKPISRPTVWKIIDKYRKIMLNE